MSLGENICRLRTARNMSQGDLAELLDVSRQSISKWETDGATPELDKLVKLALHFGVTLDELVSGVVRENEQTRIPDGPPEADSPSQAAGPTQAGGPTQVIVERRGMPGRQVAAVVLFCMAFAVLLLFTVMNAFLAGAVLAVPFLVCGLICWNAKNHPGLWCLWALFLMVDGYLRWGTGLSWATVRWTLMWEESWNYTRLAVAWVQLLCGLALLFGTAVRLRGKPLEWTKGNRRLAVIGCILFVLLCLPWNTWVFQAGGLPVAGLVTFISWLRDSLRLGLLTALLTAVLRGRKRTSISPPKFC